MSLPIVSGMSISIDADVRRAIVLYSSLRSDVDGGVRLLSFRGNETVTVPSLIDEDSDGLRSRLYSPWCSVRR